MTNKRIWVYRPSLYWYGWRSLRPFYFGDDEYHRKTIVFGWNPTGQIVIALRRFRSCREECGPFCEYCGMAAMWSGKNQFGAVRTHCPDPECESHYDD